MEITHENMMTRTSGVDVGEGGGRDLCGAIPTHLDNGGIHGGGVNRSGAQPRHTPQTLPLQSPKVQGSYTEVGSNTTTAFH